MPIERVIQLALIACAMLGGLFFLPPDLFPLAAVCFLVFGSLIIIMHHAFGWLDFKTSNLIPALSRWWGEATEESAKSWWLYLGITSFGVGCIYLIAGLGVSFIRTIIGH
jgi:hypothetical protein